MLEVKHLTKHYGNAKNKIIAIDDVSFKLNTGQITSLLGLNGAGKSTIINCISGYCTPTSGDIFINDTSVFKNEIEAKSKIGILYEQTPLYRYMCVHEFLKFSAQIHNLNGVQLDDTINEVLEFCELSEVSNRIIGNLSKGYKQRVGLAQAILHNPELIILDEPTSGLDTVQTHLFEKKILQIAKEKTILICTHNLNQAEALCTNHILLNQGKLIVNGSLSEIEENIVEAGGSCESNKNILEQAFYFFAGVTKNEFRKQTEE